MPLVSFPVTKISQSWARHRPGGHHAERSPRKPCEEAWHLPLEHQICTPIPVLLREAMELHLASPPRLNSCWKVVMVRSTGGCLFPRFPLTSSPRFPLGAQVSAVSPAVEPYLTLVCSCQEACKDEPQGPLRGTQSPLSPSHAVLWFLILNISVMLCALRISFGCCYCLPNTITHQNLFNRGNHRSKGVSSGLTKPTRQENKKYK